MLSSMIKAELFGTSLGNDSVVNSFLTKECAILLKLDNKSRTSRIEWILNAEEAKSLIQSLQKCLSEAERIGLKIV